MCTVFIIIIFLHDSQLFRFLVFVEALLFYFNVVISNSFTFIIEADLLHDRINYRVNIKLSASPALKPLP